MASVPYPFADTLPAGLTDVKNVKRTRLSVVIPALNAATTLPRVLAAATASAARWEREGWYRRSARNLLCRMLYALGASPRSIARLYS